MVALTLVLFSLHVSVLLLFSLSPRNFRDVDGYGTLSNISRYDGGAKKSPFMAKQTGFELLRLVLTNGEGALSTLRNGDVNPLKNTEKKNLTTWFDHNHKAG